MEFWTKHIVLFMILSLFFRHSSSSSISTQEEVENEREFEYKVGTVKGPEHWGNIKKEWEACNNGELQSPIDLTDSRVKIIPELGELMRSYNPCNATLKNRGHDIAIFWHGQPGSIEINGVVYNLQQSHWHSPSEHSINGRKFDLELHMVHLSSDNKIAVLGQLYQLGQADHFISKLSGELSTMIDMKHEKEVGVMNPADVLKFGGSGKKYYRYLGSLTIPPCTEGVIWTINQKIRTASMEQVHLLREVVHDYAEFNSRPAQAVNSREIDAFLPKK